MCSSLCFAHVNSYHFIVIVVANYRLTSQLQFIFGYIQLLWNLEQGGLIFIMGGFFFNLIESNGATRVCVGGF